MQTNSKFQDDALAPMHTAEHILNQTMVRLFGCPRSTNAHIERKKSKVNYNLKEPPAPEQIEQIGRMVNEVIRADMPVTVCLTPVDQLPESVSLSRLPDQNVREVRLVFIGDYDACACIGAHVTHTAQLGTFRITSTSYTDGQFRIVFRLDLP